MEKAETYPELHAECPYCGEQQEVEWIEPYGDNQEWQCAKCHKDFEYSGVEI